MSTKERILVAAARKFADHGFDGASLREVLREARVNAALGHYHFGSKQELYCAVIMRFLEPVCVQRLAVLAEVDEQLPKARRVRDLLHGYVAPHLNLCADPQAWDYVRLVARIATEPREVVARIFAESANPIREQYLRALADACGVSPSDKRLRQQFGFAVLLMAGAPVDLFSNAFSGPRNAPAKVHELIGRVVEFAATGMLSTLKHDDAPAAASRRKKRGSTA